MKYIIFAAFILCIFLPSSYSRNVQFFRKDYTYIEEFDAFYKVHWDSSGSSWNTAFLTCDDEGATLFYPKTKGEWTLVQNLTTKMIEAPNVTHIFVGLHDEFKLGEFLTVDGQSTPYPLPAEGSLLPTINDSCITMNIDTGVFNVDDCSAFYDTPLPFVCKKVDEKSCPTVDHGYKFLRLSKKCYKRNKMPQNWKEAMKTCFMEGGILTVIENRFQAQEIADNILEKGETYFVGVRKLFPRDDYYSVTGQKFSDMYQLPYSDGQVEYSNVQNEYGYLPDKNGYYPNENGEYPDYRGQFNYGNWARRAQVVGQDCGAVSNRDSSNLYTQYKNCDDRLPFICEMEVGI